MFRRSDPPLSRRELFPLVGAAALATALVPASPVSARDGEEPDDTESPERPSTRSRIDGHGRGSYGRAVARGQPPVAGP